MVWHRLRCGHALTIVRGRVQAGAGTVVENAPKTFSSCRTLPLDEGLLAVLKRAPARHAQELLAPRRCACRQRLRGGQRGGGAVHPRHAHEDVAQARGGWWCAQDPASRCPALMRHGAARSGCAAGRRRQVARPCRRRDEARSSHRDGCAAPVVMASTHERTLDVVPFEVLQEHAVDVPDDLSSL
jgi:hypothetical protein